MIKKTKQNILVLFILTLAIKIGVSFLIKDLITFPDESCVAQKAIYFAKTLHMENCQTLTNIDSGGTFPLYPLILAPIYGLFTNMTALRLALIFNSILASTLIFPLFGIFKKFTKNEKFSLIFSFIIVFSTQILTYEKMIMTELSFMIINIYLLYFYINSFSGKHKKRNKITSITLAILAIFSRPFGFISLLALMTNEFFLAKRKHKEIIIALTIPIILIIAAIINTQIPELQKLLTEELISLSPLKSLSTTDINPDFTNNWKLLLISTKNLLNTLSISTFLVPLLIFITYIKSTKTGVLKKISTFLITFITLNSIIVTQHIYRYYTQGNQLELLTRYMNVSITFIFIFSIILIQKYKKLKITKPTIISSIILITALIFSGTVAKSAQNLDIMAFYNMALNGTTRGKAHISILPILILIPIITLLLITSIRKNSNLYLKTLSITILIFSALNLHKLVIYPYNSPLRDFFIEKTDQNIIMSSLIQKIHK